MTKVCKSLTGMFLVFLVSANGFAIDDTREFKSGEMLYVHSLNGLVMRDGPGTDTKRIGSLGHGRKMLVSEDLDKSKKFAYDNIKGFWVKIKYDRKVGYAFTGFVSRFPSPKTDSLKDYSEQLKQLGLNAGYNSNLEGQSRALFRSSQESITLTNIKLLDGFLIARKLFDIPNSIKWPAHLTGKRTVAHDPNKPLAVISRNLVVLRNDSGQITQVVYSDKTKERERISVMEVVDDTTIKFTARIKKNISASGTTEVNL